MKPQHPQGEEKGGVWGGTSYLWVGEVSDPGGVRAAAESAGAARGGRGAGGCYGEEHTVHTDGWGGSGGGRDAALAAAGEDVGAVFGGWGGVVRDPHTHALLGWRICKAPPPPGSVGWYQGWFNAAPPALHRVHP